MRIALDVSSLSEPNLTGVGQYTRLLERQLSLEGDLSLIPVLKISRFKDRPVIARHLGRMPGFFHPRFRWGMKSADLFHGPDFSIPPLSSLAKVSTIHDLAEFESDFHSPEFVDKAVHSMRRLITHSNPDLFIAVSQFTKEKLTSFFPETKEKVIVVHHGADHLARPFASQKRTLKTKTILYAGSIERRKNVARLLEAFVGSKLPAMGYQLILTGKKAFGGDEILRTTSNHPQIHYLGFVPEEDYVRFFEEAQFFAFPSLYEGFGFPILEAMSFGLPVLTSKTTACGEIAGKAALKVDPTSVHEIKSALEALAESEDLRQSLGQASLQQAALFTWKKCATQTKSVYTEALRRFQQV